MDARRLEALSRQPLHVAALGLVGGECLTARANYVRLEVRDESGRLRLEHDIGRTHDWILRDMRFAGTHLVAEIGDIFVYGLRVWDVPHAVATSRVDQDSWHHERSVVLWADPVQPRVLVRYREGVAMLHAAALTVSRIDPFDIDDNAVAYDAAHDRLALGEGFDPLRLVLRDFEGPVLRACSLGVGDVDELSFTGDGRFLAVTQTGRPVVVRDTETLEVRWESASKRLLAASPCGRWLALDGALVDLHSFSAVPLPPAGGALFDPRGGELLLADLERTWRFPLP